MKNPDNEVNVLWEEICCNCNYFFPYLLHGPSEYGICLKDDEFEPYIEDLLEDEDYDCCIELIEEKKFDGNLNSCKEFEMAEIIETDSSMDEFITMDLNDEKQLTEAINFTLKNRSVEDYREKLKSPDQETRLEAFESISVLVVHDNIEALKLLIESFKEIPPPASLEDVHFKLKVFRFIKWNKHVKDLIPILIRDLYETKSTNQTRQWISEIFRFLSDHLNEENVTEYLEGMLKEKRFSYRIKNKIKDILTGGTDLMF